jgi:hypothetical protein
MIGRVRLLSCLIGMLSHAAVAQTTLNAARITGGTSNAHFTLGLTKDNGISYVTTATTADNIRIIGTIQPEAAQVGQQADIFVVARIGTQYYMRNAAGNFVPWDFGLSNLLTFRTQTLTSNLQVDFITSKIPITGTLLLFLGYRAADGVLTYTQAPHQITVTAPLPPPPPPPPPSSTTLQQATDLFASSISPILQSICIACHVSGQAAAGTGLVYVFSSNPNHLTLNFNVLKNFTKIAGRSYILAKASNTISHDGGAMLPVNSSGYKSMDSFLQLVEKL